MRSPIHLLAGAAALMTLNAFGADVVLTVRTDHSNAVYRCGEKAGFDISIVSSNQAPTSGIVRVELSRDGYAVVSTNTLDLSRNPLIKVDGTLETPGFLHCTATWIINGKTLGSGFGSAGFDPDAIQPATRFPDDFRTWWDGARGKLAAVPPDVQLEKLDAFSNAKATGYRLSVVSTQGERIHGFLSVPAGKGPFPALVTFPGAGPGFNAPDSNWAANYGVLTLSMNVHKYAVPTNAADAARAQEKYLKHVASPSVFLEGAPDPAAYHFYSVFLGIDRAIDYLTTRPDWNRKQLVFEGASQGGWLTLVMAGLKNDKVTAAAAGVPFLSDLGRSYGTASGVIKQLNALKGADALVPYYAGVNFARSIQCPVILSVGYLDSSCFPSSVYAAYNVIPSADKTLYVGPLAGHPLTTEYRQAEHAFLMKHLGLNKK